jgi:hypothetical protein
LILELTFKGSWSMGSLLGGGFGFLSIVRLRDLR